MITKSILIEKDVLDLIEANSYPKRQNLGLLTKKVKQDQMEVDIAQHIIVKDVSD